MSYAGITKGFTAIGTAMMLGSMRAGSGDALRRELFESQPQLAAWLIRQVPRMFPKAYRWIAEMEEIAQFLGDDEACRDMYVAIAQLYERIAAGAAIRNRSRAGACRAAGVLRRRHRKNSARRVEGASFREIVVFAAADRAAKTLKILGFWPASKDFNLRFCFASKSASCDMLGTLS